MLLAFAAQPVATTDTTHYLYITLRECMPNIRPLSRRISRVRGTSDGSHGRVEEMGFLQENS